MEISPKKTGKSTDRYIKLYDEKENRSPGLLALYAKAKWDNAFIE